MTVRLLSPHAALHLIELARSGSQPPAKIVALHGEIEAAKRVLALRAQICGRIDEVEVSRIVEMKLRLDSLYADWIEVALEDEVPLIVVP